MGLRCASSVRARRMNTSEHRSDSQPNTVAAKDNQKSNREPRAIGGPVTS